MSHVTLSRTCGCVIDNGDDGETFTMVYPCDLHTDPNVAIAEARAYSLVKAAARADGSDGWTVRDEDGAMHVLEVDVPSATVTAVHASSEPIHGLEAWVEAITPINERLDQGGA